MDARRRGRDSVGQAELIAASKQDGGGRNGDESAGTAFARVRPGVLGPVDVRRHIIRQRSDEVDLAGAIDDGIETPLGRVALRLEDRQTFRRDAPRHLYHLTRRLKIPPREDRIVSGKQRAPDHVSAGETRSASYQHPHGLSATTVSSVAPMSKPAPVPSSKMRSPCRSRPEW